MGSVPVRPRASWALAVFTISIACTLMTAMVGCGPWVTQIPTYWDPLPYTPAEDEPPEPVVVITPTPELPDVPVPKPSADDNDLEVDVAKDTRKECLAIYTTSSSGEVFAFKPQTNTFEYQWALDCGARFGSPFSMAVGKDGMAKIVFTDGRLFNMNLTNGKCSVANYVPGQPPGFRRFGMAYAHSGADGEEALFVGEINFNRASRGLARIDSDFKLNFIAPFSENPGLSFELSSSGSGKLYAFFLNPRPPGGVLVQIDTETAQIVKKWPINSVQSRNTLAVSFWGGFFFIFTGTPFRGTIVNRFDPETKTLEKVAEFDQAIVGAGVSTCAPSRARRRPPRRRQGRQPSQDELRKKLEDMLRRGQPPRRRVDPFDRTPRPKPRPPRPWH